MIETSREREGGREGEREGGMIFIEYVYVR